ncbi:MAG: tyrosine-protein phosphatase [Leptolyngbya sp.]|nr:tyrosine-protein phosphatase [Candidatus Melainabacteria bacterium]
MRAKFIAHSMKQTSIAIAVAVASISAPYSVIAAETENVSAEPISIAAVSPAPVVHVGNFERVSSKLYRGGAPSATALKELKEAGVKTIVNLRYPGGASAKEEVNAKNVGLEYFNVPMGYTEPNMKKVASVLDILHDPTKQPVYIHCMQGADRTGMICGIERIIGDNWQYDKVYTEMRGHKFKPFLIPMRRCVQAFATGKYVYTERQGISVAGINTKPVAQLASDKSAQVH